MYTLFWRRRCDLQLSLIMSVAVVVNVTEGLLKDDVVMLSFYPNFCSAVKSGAEQKHEFVFIIDRSGICVLFNCHILARVDDKSYRSCSIHFKSLLAKRLCFTGSMQGTKIDNAKTTLLYFLKSLPVDCYFNVISFGSRFTELFSG